MPTGFLYDERFLDHDAGARHPERRERLTSTMAHLQTQDWFEQLHMLAPRVSDEAWVESVHSRDLIDRARSACEQELAFLDVMDVGVSRESFDVALLAAGGVAEIRKERFEFHNDACELVGGLSDDQRDDILRIADRCPVHCTLRSEVDIQTR